MSNAAHVIASLHRGEKRLVFCDSRQLVEETRRRTARRGVTTFLSHASLSADERRRAEQAFAEARDCVIVATSTLELGIDVGDLDRVIQVNCPPDRRRVPAAHRPDRTPRRAATGTACSSPSTADRCCGPPGCCICGARATSSRSSPPPEPRHIVAQQLLALCLQKHRIGSRLWADEWNGLPPFDRSAEPILRYLVEQRVHRPGRRAAVHRPGRRERSSGAGTSWA